MMMARASTFTTKGYMIIAESLGKALKFVPKDDEGFGMKAASIMIDCVVSDLSQDAPPSFDVDWFRELINEASKPLKWGRS